MTMTQQRHATLTPLDQRHAALRPLGGPLCDRAAN